MVYTRTFLLVILSLLVPVLAVAVQQQKPDDPATLAFRRSLYGALNTGDAEKLASLIDRVDAKQLDDLLLYSLGQNPRTPVEVVRLLLDKPR